MSRTATDDGARGDLRWGTTPRLLRDVASRHPDREAIVDLSADGPAQRISYEQLRSRSDEMARALIAAGIEPGDRVSIWAPNCWEWVVALMGIHSVGAAVVPLNTRYKGIEAGDILRRSGSRLLFGVEGFLGNEYVSMLRDTGGELPDLERIVLLRDTGTVPDGVERLDDFLAAGSAVDPAEVDVRIKELEPTAMSDLLYTSGTTGAPKGVIQTHEKSLRAFSDWADIVGLRGDDRYLIINPFFHSFGFKAGILASLMAGCTMVPIGTFDVDLAVEVIKAEAISMIPGPPTIYQTLLHHPSFDPSEFSTLRLAVTGAASVPVELVHQMRDVLGFETVVTAYGLTEACGVVSVCRADDDPETIANTSGRAIPGVEVVIVDGEGHEVASDHPGEVLVRGYNVMVGYFEDPDQTAEAIDSSGWLHTGDIGVMDQHGYVQITDRRKDMFIVGGFNAYPAEIEALLLAHPGIAQAAVVGVPDERMGEIGHAFVVPRTDVVLDPAEVVSWARDNMANYKAPRIVEVIDALPLNASGKVLKFELRSRATSGSPRSGDREATT